MSALIGIILVVLGLGSMITILPFYVSAYPDRLWLFIVALIMGLLGCWLLAKDDMGTSSMG